MKLAILVASFLFIFVKLKNSPSLEMSWLGLRELLSDSSVWLAMTGIFLMMMVNWMLEAWKWKYLVRKSESVSIFRALKAVLAGITVSTFTPNRVGEFFGRVFILKHTNPWKGAFMTIVGSISQLVVTIVAGCVCFVIFAYHYFPYEEYFSPVMFWGIAVALILLAGFSLLLYYNIRLLDPLFRRITFKRWTSVRKQLEVFNQYTAKELSIVLAYSAGRYIVFTLQYYFLLRMFRVPLDLFDGVLIISCIYLFMTAVPTIALSELGVRGSLAVFFMEVFYRDNFVLSDIAAFGAVSASTLIWVINLVIPALIGGIFVLELKFFRHKEA